MAVTCRPRICLKAVIITLLACFTTIGNAASPSATHSAPLRVAVASNFRPLLDKLAAQFLQRTGIELEIISASSGTHYSQMLNGAPMDVFLSADRLRPELLETQGLAVPGSRHTYALGRLALWQRDGSDVNAQTLHLWPGKLAIANPALAPYGAAAQQVLEHLELWSSYAPRRLIQGNNIAQAMQFVASGNVGLGLVALSDLRLLGLKRGVWIVPVSLHSPIEQQLVILQRSSRVPEAKLFSAFILSADVQQQIAAAGYMSAASSGTDQ